MAVHVRVCRDCGEEFQPQVARCSDCGGELEDRQLDEDGADVDGEDAAGEAPGAPEARYRSVFVTPRAAELVPLAEALRAAEVPYRLVEEPARTEGAAPRYALLVPEEAASAALDALAPQLAPEPDAAQAGGDASFEAGRGYLRCPACGAEQPAGAEDCGECGLALGGPAEELASCARCGAPLPEPGGACPACGNTPLG